MKNSRRETGAEEYERYYLKPGYIYLSLNPTIITTILGTCISVCFFDERLRYGGMNHYQFARKKKGGDASAFYGDVAIDTLFRMFLKNGSRPEDLRARIIGGAYSQGNDTTRIIANNNEETASRMLAKLNIPIISRHTGNHEGRKVFFMTDRNRIKIVLFKKNISEEVYEES